MPYLHTTRNGIRILVEELPHTHSIAIGCFIDIGARYETAEIAGAAHFIEHMLFKGAGAYPTAHAISLAIEGVGGYLNASTGYETTAFYAKVAAIHFNRALHVLSEMVQRPLFDAHELEKERRVIIEEIRGIQDNPTELVHELLQQTMWGDHPFGRDIAGRIDTVSAIARHELLQFFAKGYHAGTLVISVAGNIMAEQAIPAIEQAFADVPAGQRPIALPAPSLPIEHRLNLLPRDIEQGNFCLGLPGVSYHDPDRRAVQALDALLGGGMSSRLFQTIREEHGLSYNIGSYHNEFADTGMWVIYAGVEPDALRDAVAMTRAIIRDVVEHGPTDQELTTVKEQLKGSLLLSLEDTWAIASRNATSLLRYQTVPSVEQIIAEIDALTLADLQRAAHRLLSTNQQWLAVVGPYAEDDEADLQALLEG
ncbi:MAG: peptidase M16 [Chloroflexus sp.]|uniref:M16 family metallopeptidase n=1 Tax=Chloroflexus sp. TaxID=1904827 RepID=UPI0021DBAF11|nr:pitrilysin family protein [Chloroflexus sp.]GIV89599.1 MAG: peptidase M16 [Chloroflexus sp.]